MRTADLTTRSVAGFIDLLLITGLTRLPDITGFLSAIGYILIRDGLFARQSIGKKLIGLRIVSAEGTEQSVSFRESIIRNTPLAAAYLLWWFPVAGWLLAPLALGIEYITALGDERSMRIGDILARTLVVAEKQTTAGSAGPMQSAQDASAAPQPPQNS